MAQKRSFFLKDVRAENYMRLTDKAKVLLWDLKANTDDYGFIDQMTVSKAVTGATDKEVNELIQQGYLYDFGNNKYLLRWFQKDNNIQYQKTQQTTCPNELQYVYLDNEYYYHVSLTPVRPIKGWNTIYKKVTKKNGKEVESEYSKDKDVVVPRDYLFEGMEKELDGDYKITPVDNNAQQAPSTEVDHTVSTQVKEVAPKQEVKPAPVQSNFDIKSKIANAESIEQEETAPVQPEPTANSYTKTKQGQQEVEQLRKKYGVANQTRSMSVQTEEEDTSLPFGNDEDTQVGLSREAQDTQLIDYNAIDTSDLPFPD